MFCEGVLHMEIFMQRLEQEFGATPVITLPSVPYRAKLKYAKQMKEHGGAEVVEVRSPLELPPPHHVDQYFEPFIQATIITPFSHLENVLNLVSTRRSKGENVSVISDTRYMVVCRMPLSEVITDFNDSLKKFTSGFWLSHVQVQSFELSFCTGFSRSGLASFDYEDSGFEEADLARVDFKLNKEVVDEFSIICHRDVMKAKCRQMVDRLVEHVPKKQFEIRIQAVVHNTSEVVAK